MLQKTVRYFSTFFFRLKAVCFEMPREYSSVQEINHKRHFSTKYAKFTAKKVEENTQKRSTDLIAKQNIEQNRIDKAVDDPPICKSQRYCRYMLKKNPKKTTHPSLSSERSC